MRPGWRILWSGWDWDARSVQTAVRNAWEEGIPVYLSRNPLSWSNFEAEFLELHFLLGDSRQEQVVPMLFRVLPPDGSPEPSAHSAGEKPAAAF
jgi:hypothetical protein